METIPHSVEALVLVVPNPPFRRLSGSRPCILIESHAASGRRGGFVVPEALKMALFADAVSLINSHNTKAAAEKELQRAVTAIAEWRISKKMVLNADKGEVTNSHEMNWWPTITANHTCLLHNARSELLTVTLDRPAHPRASRQKRLPDAECSPLSPRRTGVEKRSADESLQSSAAQPPRLRASSMATLCRPFLHRAAGELPKIKP